MADVGLVIKIPEGLKKDFESEQWTALTCMEMKDALINSIPLPKGHGRLIDADALDKDLENAQVNLEDALSEAFDDGLAWASEVASKLPTIIDAEKESEDK